jgi:hypothetical protein
LDLEPNEKVKIIQLLAKSEEDKKDNCIIS